MYAELMITNNNPLRYFVITGTRKNTPKILIFDKLPTCIFEILLNWDSCFCYKAYSDSQKHESSCLLSDRFWCIFLPLLASIFEELSDRKGIFRIGAQIHLILRKNTHFSKKKSAIEKNPPF